MVVRRLGFLVSGGLCAALAGAASLVVVVGWSVGSPFAGRGSAYGSIVVFATLVRMAVFVAGRPDRLRRYHGYFDEVTDAIKQATVGSVAIVVFTFFWRDGTRFTNPRYSRGVFVADWALAAVLLSLLAIGAKQVLGRWRRSGGNSLNVVVMGSSGTAAALVAALDGHPETGYRVVGVVDDRGPDEADAVEELRQLAASIDVDEVVLSSPQLTRKDVDRLVSLPELSRARVTAAPHLFGLPPTKARLSRVGDFPLLALNHEPLPGARRAFKRALDVLIASVALVLASPVMLLVAIAIRLTSTGPSLFRQARIGMDGRRFRVLKFRTMRVDSDTSEHRAFVREQFTGLGTASKIAHDPRVTRLGAFLRATSIDELPQLVNVLLGHMSIVGPRPALDYEVELYQDWQRRRLEVRPGLTGLWQVSGRSKLSFQEMHRLDIQYIDNWTPFEDMKIIVRTIPALLRRDAAMHCGVRAPGSSHVRMFGVEIDALTMEETIDRVEEFVASGVAHQHTCINAAKAVKIVDEPAFGDVVRRSHLISADGMAIVWAARALGRALPERVSGIDLFDQLLVRASQRGWRVYFLGATQAVVETAAAVSQQRHPGLIVAGCRDGYFSEDEEPEVVAQVALTEPDLIFVAMPTPRKEEFLDTHLDALGASFVMGVGGTFDVVAGKTSRAPVWMQRIGMEWFHRLMQEPRRMFKRYLVGNTRFIALVARERLRGLAARDAASGASPMVVDLRRQEPTLALLPAEREATLLGSMSR
jgi:exopolysaccharide biosynthesis polyprenyl glycosylphosphotransferase